MSAGDHAGGLHRSERAAVHCVVRFAADGDADQHINGYAVYSNKDTNTDLNPYPNSDSNIDLNTDTDQYSNGY